MDEIQQHWLYALSAPMVSINPGAGYLEPAFYAGPSPIDLDGSWGINDRDQLFGMLSLADNGHARHLNEAYHQWVTVGETAKQCGNHPLHRRHTRRAAQQRRGVLCILHGRCVRKWKAPESTGSKSSCPSGKSGATYSDEVAWGIRFSTCLNPSTGKGRLCRYP